MTGTGLDTGDSSGLGTGEPLGLSCGPETPMLASSPPTPQSRAVSKVGVFKELIEVK